MNNDETPVVNVLEHENAIKEYREKTGEKVLHQTNQKQMKERNVAICFNTFCPSITEYSVDQERCPECSKRLSKSISGAKLFEAV